MNVFWTPNERRRAVQMALYDVEEIVSVAHHVFLHGPCPERNRLTRGPRIAFEFGPGEVRESLEGWRSRFARV
jgi:hypothetical protein